MLVTGRSGCWGLGVRVLVTERSGCWGLGGQCVGGWEVRVLGARRSMSAGWWEGGDGSGPHDHRFDET